MREGTGRGVRIAIIDSGVEVDHPDLDGLKLRDDLHIVDTGFQVEMRSGDGTDIYGHGTAIAAVIRSPHARSQLGGPGP